MLLHAGLNAHVQRMVLAPLFRLDDLVGFAPAGVATPAQTEKVVAGVLGGKSALLYTAWQAALQTKNLGVRARVFLFGLAGGKVIMQV